MRKITVSLQLIGELCMNKKFDVFEEQPATLILFQGCELSKRLTKIAAVISSNSDESFGENALIQGVFYVYWVALWDMLNSLN